MAKQKKRMGFAAFTVKCSPFQVELFIHGKHRVAVSEKDVYRKIFDQVVKTLGGRIDGYK